MDAVWVISQEETTMENVLTAIAVLAGWLILQVWLLPRLGVPT